MALHNLVPLFAADGSWASFIDDWRGQCEQYGEDFDAYSSGSFSVLNDLAHNQEPKSGVFALRREERFDAVCQANVAMLPGYQGPVLRIRMMLVAPVYDFGDLSVEDYAKLLVDLFGGVYLLSVEQMVARHIKFHLRSPADRTFFSAIGVALGNQPAFETVQVSGGWLYVTKRHDGRT